MLYHVLDFILAITFLIMYCFGAIRDVIIYVEFSISVMTSPIVYLFGFVVDYIVRNVVAYTELSIFVTTSLSIM